LEKAGRGWRFGKGLADWETMRKEIEDFGECWGLKGLERERAGDLKGQMGMVWLSNDLPIRHMAFWLMKT